MRIRRSWLAAGAGLLIAIGLASLPWSLSPDQTASRLTEATAPYGYHWESPVSATLRAFPEPILDLFDVRLADAKGTIAFTASTIAIRLSISDFLVGRYTPVRARVKDPVGDLDLDALMAALPRMAEGPPVAALQARGGRLRLRSARLGLDETLGSMSASFNWSGASSAFRANLAGLWRGQWTTLEGNVSSPKALLAGQATDVELVLAAAGAKTSLEGSALLGDKPTFAGNIALNARSLAELAGWTGFDTTSLPDTEAAISGKGSLSPDTLSLEDGRLLLKGQTLDGELDLQHGPKGWSASATLAADALDLTALLGPFPALHGLEGG